jgi:lipoate-protein ligase B
MKVMKKLKSYVALVEQTILCIKELDIKRKKGNKENYGVYFQKESEVIRSIFISFSFSFLFLPRLLASSAGLSNLLELCEN